jgi:hypothetical protein
MNEKKIKIFKAYTRSLFSLVSIRLLFVETTINVKERSADILSVY